jgi:hypothetical protein
MNDYQNAPACRLLATHCACCGRALLDSVSVELGIGPECRSHFRADLSPEQQKTANVLVFAAAIAAQQGKVQEVLALADRIENECLMGELAGRIRERFTNAVAKTERNADIIISLVGEKYLVNTPYRRAAKVDFIAAWRAIPGRYFDRARGVNVIPVSQKPALWDLLKKFFPGKYGKGPAGVFRVPVAAKV